MFPCVGNLQTATKALSRAAEAVQLTRDGWTEESIAERLSVSTSTVRNYLHRFMDSQSLLGSDLTPEEVAEYRSLRRERLLTNEERLIERREHLRSLPTDGVEEECSVAGALVKVCDSITRTSEALASLDGLRVNTGAPAIMTQNNLTITGGDEIQYLRDLARLKELQRNGQS
jgi:predicted transcriptional regulator